MAALFFIIDKSRRGARCGHREASRLARGHCLVCRLRRDGWQHDSGRAAVDLALSQRPRIHNGEQCRRQNQGPTIHCSLLFKKSSQRGWGSIALEQLAEECVLCRPAPNEMQAATPETVNGK